MNALVVLSTVGAIGAGAYSWKMRAAGPPPPPEISEFAGWRALAASTSSLLGPREAPVTIVVFTDFQCPFCKTFAAIAKQALRERAGTVRVVIRHFPIERLHIGAMGAAKAAVCASNVGRFEVMHDVLYASQDSLGVVPWGRLALEAGIADTVDFHRCMGARATARIIEQDTTSARKVGVRATPTVLVNEVVVPWTPTRALLDSLIQNALSRRRDDGR